MARMAAFRFTALDNPVLAEEVRRHIGARRFAYNRCLEAVKDKALTKSAGTRRDGEVAWSGYSLINFWNRVEVRKKNKRAGSSPSTPRVAAELVDSGLSWRHEVCAQVFEEAAVDLGRASPPPTRRRSGARAVVDGSASRTSARRAEVRSRSGCATRFRRTAGCIDPPR